MPLYEYRCTQCDHHFELHHQVGAPAGPCPVCGGPVRRIFTSVGLIFKGSGFHTTDYRRTAPQTGDTEKKDITTAKESGGERKTKGTEATSKSE